MADAIDRITSDEFTQLIDRRVIQLFAHVTNAVSGATLALLSDDCAAASSLAEEDAQMRSLQREVEQMTATRLSMTTTPADRIHHLTTVYRLLPELQRGGDLAEQIARQTRRGHAAEMSARSRGLLEQMGEVTAKMWSDVADTFGDGSFDSAERVELGHREVTLLYSALLDDLANSAMASSMIIELALIGASYQRLGDHALSLARHTVRLAAAPVGTASV